MEIITTTSEKFPVMSSEDEEDLNEVVKKRNKSKIMPIFDDDDDDSDNEEPNVPDQTPDDQSQKGENQDLQTNEGNENISSQNNSDSENEPIRMFRSQNQTITNDEDDSAESENDSSDDDDDSPPIRIFRSKSTADVGEGRGLQSDLYDDERDDDEIMPDPSEIAEPRPPKPREAKRTSMRELQSETQRLIRESVVNLPYHRPESKRLSDFMKRPTIKREHEESKEEKVKEQDEADIDDLPMFNTKDKNDTTDVTEQSHSQQSVINKLPIPDILSNENVTSLEKAEEAAVQDKGRPLTNKERLLKRLGNNLSKLSPKISSEDSPKFINLDEDSTPSKASGVNSLMERFLKHSKARRPTRTPEKVEISIIRKEDRVDGSGVELVSEVVEATVTEDDKVKNEFEDVKNCDISSTPGQRLQLLRKRLALKMKKRREIERKRREENYKLDNEEMDDEPEEEECDWSDDSDEEEQDEQDVPITDEKKSDLQCNGLIDDSDDESDLEETQPTENNVKPKDSLSPHVSVATSCDSSFPRMISDGSVLLFDDSTRSSVSTLNKSSVTDGRITPALDRTCSDDSFYSSLIPLRQPEISNISTCSNFAKSYKKGEFDDTDFDTNSRSQPFHLEFEASQSQLLDADGFIKESKEAKKSDAPILPPGAEDDNATDCNMTQLLDLCSAPFNSPKTQDRKGLSSLMADSTASTTQDLIGLCSGNFDDSASQLHLKDNETISNITKESDESAKEKTAESCDITSENENSSDLFGTQEFKDQSFGFTILPSNSQKPHARIEFSDESDDDEPMTIIRSKKMSRQKIALEYVENEAELSGSEAGSDDEDEDEADEYEMEDPVEELPQDEEIQRQVNRVHMRQVLEEDQRDLELLQEAFMGGEEIVQRERKFRWKNVDSNQHLFNSDGEGSNHGDDDDNRGIEDSQWRKERLQREEFLRNEENHGDGSEDSQLLKFGRQLIMSRQNSITSSSVQEVNQAENLSRKGRLSVDETSNSRDSFMHKGRKGSFLTRSKNVLDKLASLQELKNVNGPKNTDKMLFKTVSPKAEKRKRSVTNQQTKGPSKKRKKIVVYEDSNSVFDLF